MKKVKDLQVEVSFLHTFKDIEVSDEVFKQIQKCFEIGGIVPMKREEFKELRRFLNKNKVCYVPYKKAYIQLHYIDAKGVKK